MTNKICGRLRIRCKYADSDTFPPMKEPLRTIKNRRHLYGPDV